MTGKNQAIVRLLRAHPEKSSRAIARLAGVSNSTVSAARRKLKVCDTKPHTADHAGLEHRIRELEKWRDAVEAAAPVDGIAALPG